MIDVTAYNAFILWCEVLGRNHTNRRQFLKMLGSELCGGELDDKEMNFDNNVTTKTES